MQEKIIEFTNLLRKSGVRVSVSESIDAFTAVDELSFADRELFKTALRATMIKRGDEIPTYDELFDLFWSGFYDNLRDAFGEMSGDMGEMGIDLEDLMRQLAEMLGQMDGDMDLSDLAKALLTQDLSMLENLIREAAQQAGTQRIENMLQVGFFSRRTMEGLGVEGAGEELEDLAQRLEDMGLSPEQIEQLRNLIGKLMETLRKVVRNFTERRARCARTPASPSWSTTRASRPGTRDACGSRPGVLKSRPDASWRGWSRWARRTSSTRCNSHCRFAARRAANRASPAATRSSF